MSSRTDNSDRKPCCLFTEEEAGQLVLEALDTSPDEPEPLVKLLLILFDNTEEPDLKEAIHWLMRSAYNGSIVHSIDYEEYLEAIRKGKDPLKEARARWYGDQKSRDSS